MFEKTSIDITTNISQNTVQQPSTTRSTTVNKRQHLQTNTRRPFNNNTNPSNCQSLVHLCVRTCGAH
eukprot:5717012-Heterocapsa_arctica.AAC.1